MKKFKLKDLLVAVVPQEEQGVDVCQAGASRCAAPTCGQFGQTCFMRTCPLNTCDNNTCLGGTCAGTVTCFGGTGCPNFTCLDFSRCLNRTCRFVTNGFTVIEQPGVEAEEQLAQLRQELRTALGEVEARVSQAEARQEPRTFEEVEALERRLRDALEELAARKKALKPE